MVERKLRSDVELPSIFIEGWMSDRIKAGDYPDYSIDYGKLPEVPEGSSMEVKSLFMLALENARKMA